MKKNNNAHQLLSELQKAFVPLANQSKATQQQAYMKSSMPFYGIIKPEVDAITKALCKEFAPADNAEYQATIEYIFEHATHRELWYAALTYAFRFKKYIIVDNVDLFLNIIKKTQWWDIVDPVAADLVGKALSGSEQLNHYTMLWITDSNMWVRRTALLTQLKYKKQTDIALQETLIMQVAHEKEFFIRKAIGWTLRELSKTHKEAVQQYIATHGGKLSGLSVREASKYL